MLELINEILDLSKIESGKIEIHPETIEIDEFVRDIELLFRPIMEKKELDFNVDIQDGLDFKLHTDIQRLQQILQNLLSNAIKFTQKGSVSVKVYRPDDGFKRMHPEIATAGLVAFTVSDTGIGIPQDKKQVIFEAFQQADGTMSRRFGGTGLGLTISRSFAQLLGGDIFLETEEGKGSTFTLAIPIKYIAGVKADDNEKLASIPQRLPRRPMSASAPAPAPAQQQPSSVQLPAGLECNAQDDRAAIVKGDKCLLIIEDDLSFARLLYDLAVEHGFKCIIAESGECGLYFAEVYEPNAIILDIGLPGINGWEVMERLKENPATRHIPVHFISGSDESTEALKLGAIGYLTKPVSIDKMREAFDRIEDVISRPMKRLLVIEDDRVIQQSIVDLIGNGDVKTTAVAKGAEAYVLLEKEGFDCIILDLGLEDMSGFELIEKIRSNTRFSQIPIIIYTSRDLTREQEERLQRYADSIIIKGIRSPERLLAETTLFLHRVEANLPKEKQEILRMLYSKEDAFHDKTILVVDDDPRNVFAITCVLEEKGLRILTAGTGKDGVDMLVKNSDIDLVLMDIMMPVMDGYEAIGLIRKMDKYAKLPIIALTAKAMKEDREKCIEAGANEYLAKPVDTQKLLSLLRVWLYQ